MNKRILQGLLLVGSIGFMVGCSDGDSGSSDSGNDVNKEDVSAESSSLDKVDEFSIEGNLLVHNVTDDGKGVLVGSFKPSDGGHYLYYDGEVSGDLKEVFKDRDTVNLVKDEPVVSYNRKENDNVIVDIYDVVDEEMESFDIGTFDGTYLGRLDNKNEDGEFKYSIRDLYRLQEDKLGLSILNIETGEEEVLDITEEAKEITGKEVFTDYYGHFHEFDGKKYIIFENTYLNEEDEDAFIVVYDYDEGKVIESVDQDVYTNSGSVTEYRPDYNIFVYNKDSGYVFYDTEKNEEIYELRNVNMGDYSFVNNETVVYQDSNDDKLYMVDLPSGEKTEFFEREISEDENLRDIYIDGDNLKIYVCVTNEDRSETTVEIYNIK